MRQPTSPLVFTLSTRHTQPAAVCRRGRRTSREGSAVAVLRPAQRKWSERSLIKSYFAVNVTRVQNYSAWRSQFWNVLLTSLHRGTKCSKRRHTANTACKVCFFKGFIFRKGHDFCFRRVLSYVLASTQTSGELQQHDTPVQSTQSSHPLFTGDLHQKSPVCIVNYLPTGGLAQITRPCQKLALTTSLKKKTVVSRLREWRLNR